MDDAKLPNNDHKKHATRQPYGRPKTDRAVDPWYITDANAAARNKLAMQMT